MKQGLSIFTRFLAIFVVIFWGISVAIPQKTQKDDDFKFPLWTDIDIEADADIAQVYKRGIIAGKSYTEYGKETPITAGEAAYAVVRMYEDKKDMVHKYKYYNPEQDSAYIKQAKKYKLWYNSLPEASDALTYEEFTALLSKTIGKTKKINSAERIVFEEEINYKDGIIKMYEAGIMAEPGMNTAFSTTEKITRKDAVKLVMMCLDADKRIKIKIPNYEKLETKLQEKMSGWQGDWSLYFEDCKTGHKISINSHKVYSASLIKLFVAQTVYDKIANGKLQESTKIDNEITKMITYSDNAAWKYLARKLGGGVYSKGMAAVTKVAQESEFSDTGTFYEGNRKNYNFTSVEDCGEYLHKILEGTIVNEYYSKKILSLLKQQQHLHKIPSGVPDSIVTANKTGELDYMQGDAAIVYAPNGTYILVIIGDGLDNAYGQMSKFTELSKLVYEHLN